MTRHATRTVRIFALYRDDVNGSHFGVVRSGTWAELIPYLNTTARYVGSRNLFIEGADGALSPLMA